jgi:ribosomal protein S18 acetylase RimI-like enzyme
MISFSLSENDFTSLGVEYDIVKIDRSNFESNKQYVIDSINNFNSEIEWNEMFTLEEANNRVFDNMRMYLGLIDSKVFGHVWFKNYKDGSYLFNLFVKNKAKTENYTGTKFTSDIINRFENEYPIYANVDEWNEKSIKLFDRLGFKRN